MPLKTLLKSLGIRSHLPPHVSSPSAAQLCPEDILRIVYYDASRADCIRGALVCRAWYDACITELYRTFPHTTLHLDSYHSYGIKWMDYLYRSKVLRARVQFIVLRMILQPSTAPMSSILTPLAPIFTPKLTKSPSPSYLQIDGCWHVGQAPRIIAKSGMIRHVSHLDLRYAGDFQNYHHASSNFKAALRVILPAASSLVSFSARLATLSHIQIPSHGNPSPLRPIPLRRLSLSIGVLGAEALPLLVAVTDTLVQLHLTFEKREDRDRDIDRNACIAAISRMHGLVELMVEVDERYGSTLPILDEIVLHLPNLRYLFCGKGSFTATLRVPATLEGLYITAPLPHYDISRPPPPTLTYESSPYDMMRVLLASSKTNKTSLRSLYWWWIDRGSIRDERPPAVRELEAMAREVDVNFQCDSDWYIGMRKWKTDSLEPDFSVESMMAPTP